MRHLSMLALATAALGMTTACDPIDHDEREALQTELADPETDPEVRAEIEGLLDLDLAEAGRESAGSCFFCPPPPPSNSPPIVKNAYAADNAQSKTIMYMDAAGSYIQLGATMTMQVPFTTQSYGPFTMSYTDSGTQFKAVVTGYFPLGTCRMVTVTNPNAQVSAPATVCR